MKLTMSSSIASCLLASAAFATDTIPSCEPANIPLIDLQPYENATYSIEGTDAGGAHAERLFLSMGDKPGKVHKDRFGQTFFEERDRLRRTIPMNERYHLLEWNYCRKSDAGTRCITFCTVNST